MADNELDETTANLYVDFLHRRAVSDMAKIRKRSPKSGLAEVEEEFEDESELESHKKSQRKVSDDRFAYVQDHGILKEGPSRAFVHRSQAQRGSGNKKHLVENPSITEEKKWAVSFQSIRPEKDLDEVRMRQIKVRMLQSKIDQSRKALMLKEEAEKKRQLEEVRKERQHPLKVFLTSQPDLLSTPFDYEEAVKDKLNALHSTDNIEVRIGEIDSKLDYLRRQRESPLPSRPIEDGFDEGPLPKEGQELVRRWQNDRKEREERQRRRLERQQEKERLQLQEELEKKQQEELLKKKIRVANSEAKLHDMNQKRVMRAEMHRYQSKVVTELIRHPRTYYFFKASEEAIEKVRQKLKGKFESHKVKLDEQRSRLQEIENQWAAD